MTQGVLVAIAPNDGHRAGWGLDSRQVQCLQDTVQYSGGTKLNPGQAQLLEYVLAQASWSSVPQLQYTHPASSRVNTLRRPVRATLIIGGGLVRDNLSQPALCLQHSIALLSSALLDMAVPVEGCMLGLVVARQAR